MDMTTKVIIGSVAGLVLVLLVAFLTKLVLYRNRMIRDRERIQQARGDVNNAKAYLDIVTRRGSIRGVFINVFTGGKGSKKCLEAEQKYLEARKRLDALVHPFNQKVQVFPDNVFAAILHIEQENYADESH